MGYRVAICDDSREDAAFENALLQEWAKARQIDAEAELFFSAEEFLFHYEENAAYDMLLLDIEMGGMDGVSMAKRIRRENAAVQIVFITGYSDYIAEGYEVAALHYLMKAVSRDKLFAVLDRAADNCRRNEIRYLDVRLNYVTVHAKQDYTVKRPLGEFERELDEGFFRTGRALILNLRQIRRATRTEVFLADGTALPLPRGAYEPLNRAIIAHT